MKKELVIIIPGVGRCQLKADMSHVPAGAWYCGKVEVINGDNAAEYYIYNISDTFYAVLV